MSFSGTAEDNEQSRKEFRELFNQTLAKARAMSNETMNSNGQFYARDEAGTVTVTEDSYNADIAKTKPIPGRVTK